MEESARGTVVGWWVGLMGGRKGRPVDEKHGCEFNEPNPVFA